MSSGSTLQFVVRLWNEHCFSEAIWRDRGRDGSRLRDYSRLILKWGLEKRHMFFQQYMLFWKSDYIEKFKSFKDELRQDKLLKFYTKAIKGNVLFKSFLGQIFTIFYSFIHPPTHPPTHPLAHSGGAKARLGDRVDWRFLHLRLGDQGCASKDGKWAELWMPHEEVKWKSQQRKHF